MSSSQSKKKLYSSISESSTLLELLSAIHLSSEAEDIKEAHRILICWEKDLLSEMRDLKKEVENLKKERDLFQELHCLAELDKICMEQDLKKRQVEREELTERVNRLIEEHRLSVDKNIRAEERYKNAIEEAKWVETEGRRKMEEITEKNEELEEEILRYRDNLSVLQEMAEVFQKEDVTADVRKGSGDDHNCPPVRSFTDSPGDHALLADYRTLDVEVCNRKQAGHSSMVSAEGLDAPIIFINSDDGTSASESAGIAKIHDSKSNSGEEEIRWIKYANRRSSVKSEEVNIDASLGLLNRRKRSLIDGVGIDRPAISKQKTQKSEGIFHGDKGSLVNVCSSMCDPVASRIQSFSDTIDSSSNDLLSEFKRNDESIGGSDIDNTFAKLKNKAQKPVVDLLSEFKRNDELCMKAVCALYRRIISAEKLNADPSTPANMGLSHFIAMRGKDLATFLINGDPRHQLRRSVAEMKETCPGDLEKCRELAIQYKDKLFEIYCKGEDLFFCAYIAINSLQDFGKDPSLCAWP